jgi:hypothetical protein
MSLKSNRKKIAQKDLVGLQIVSSFAWLQFV